MSLFEQAKQYFDAHADPMTADLASLVKLPSIKGETIPSAPYGQACADCLRTAYHLFVEQGFVGTLYEQDGYALIYDREGVTPADCIGIFVHTDVVPVGEGWSKTRPFVPHQEDGFLYGRGVEDNKAGVVQALWLLKFFKDNRITLPKPVMVFLGSEEETGMQDIKAFVKAHTPPALSLVPDGEYPVSIGEKSMARVWLHAKTPLSFVKDLEGGQAFNVVLGEAKATLLYEDGMFLSLFPRTAMRQNMAMQWQNGEIHLSAYGVPKHAAMPEGSVNAAALLCETLASVAKGQEQALLENAAAILHDPWGKTLGIACTDAVFGDLTATNGMVHMQDGMFSLSLDVRFGTETDAEQLLDTLRTYALQSGFDTEIISCDTGFYLGKENQELAAILQAMQTATGKEASPIVMGGGTYARHLPCAYSMATALPGYASPVLPKGHGTAHAADECLCLAAWRDAAAALADALWAVCKK